MRIAALALALGLPYAAQSLACGEVVTLNSRGDTTLRYALKVPADPKGAMVLLAGGAGFLDLDDQGCPRRLKGNSLVRFQPIFQREGFATALVDAPSDHQGPDGLADFRAKDGHAQDLGKVIADLRARLKLPVWVIGTSRGAISAANAASRLAEGDAPDGVILTSVVTVGTARGRKAFTAQTVYDNPLERIKMPFLIVGHESDACLRSPASAMGAVLERVASPQKQRVTVRGGPGSRKSGLEACEGRSPHGFWEQDEEVATGLARFVRTGRY